MLTESDRLRFETLVVRTAANGRDDFGIGTYKEKSLHYILKNFFESDSDFHEVAFKGYVADVKNSDGITEIQTSTLYGLNGKLDAFLPECKVRIVYPISLERHIVWIDPENGNAVRSKRASLGGTVFDLLAELVYIVDYLAVANLTVTAVFIKTDDYRILDGYGKDRKKRATKVDKIPTELVDIRDFHFPCDIDSLIPETISSEFGREEFSKTTKLKGRSLWAALKVLEKTGAVERVPAKGRKIVYRRVK